MKYIKVKFEKQNDNCCLLCELYYNKKCQSFCDFIYETCSINDCAPKICDTFIDTNNLIIEE